VVRIRPNPWIEEVAQPQRIVGPDVAMPGDLLLHLGEAWYPPAPGVGRELESVVTRVRWYPDSLSVDLRHALAEYCGHGLTADNIAAGNGSDWLIDLLICAFAGPERPVIAPSPTFFAYGKSAVQRRTPVISIGRKTQDRDFALDAESLLKALPKEAGIVFLASPNNPTGDLVSLETITRIASSTSALIVIDECYYEFAQETAIGLVGSNPNIVILRSLSKSFALAGLRIGYAVSNEEVINALCRVDQTFSVNVVAQKCAIAALNSIDYYRPLFAQTSALRDNWCDRMSTLGMKVFPSRANILLTDYSALTDINLAKVLRQRGIYVADYFDRAGVRNAFCTAVDNEASLHRFSQTLEEILSR
jgi:histidinol-phosphate aminotransferase